MLTQKVDHGSTQQPSMLSLSRGEPQTPSLEKPCKSKLHTVPPVDNTASRIRNTAHCCPSIVSSRSCLPSVMVVELARVFVDCRCLMRWRMNYSHTFSPACEFMSRATMRPYRPIGQVSKPLVFMIMCFKYCSPKTSAKMRIRIIPTNNRGC